MDIQAKKLFSPEAYLEVERASDTKSEYFQGEIFAMSGASFAHNRINENLSVSFGNFLKGKKCQAFSQDLRVHIPFNTLFTYPDFLVTCPPFLFYEDGMKDTLINPILIIEILSASTESYNRGKKFQLYQGIESLREYAVINSEGEFGIQKFYKNDWGIWESSFSGSSAEDSVLFQSLDFTMSLGEIYENVEMSEE